MTPSSSAAPSLVSRHGRSVGRANGALSAQWRGFGDDVAMAEEQEDGRL